MALTLNENFRWTAGGKAFRNYAITHDASTSTIYAVSMDLEYIEGIIGAHTHYSSILAVVNTGLSVAADHKTIVISVPAKAASVTNLTVVGW